MKMYITVKDYASFQSIVAGGNYISSNADDFQFQWGNNEVQPDTHVTLGMLLVIPLQVVDVICRTG